MQKLVFCIGLTLICAVKNSLKFCHNQRMCYVVKNLIVLMVSKMKYLGSDGFRIA